LASITALLNGTSAQASTNSPLGYICLSTFAPHTHTHQRTTAHATRRATHWTGLALYQESGPWSDPAAGRGRRGGDREQGPALVYHRLHPEVHAFPPLPKLSRAPLFRRKHLTFSWPSSFSLSSIEYRDKLGVAAANADVRLL
jgi:hypothetical protein